MFTVKGDAGKTALDRWINWARRSRIPAFIKLQRRLVKHRAAIYATRDSGLSNALVESTNARSGYSPASRILWAFPGIVEGSVRPPRGRR